jgi:hypothetical protein
MKKIIHFFLLTIISATAWSQSYPNLIPYRASELWGYCDTSGKIKIKPQFDAAGLFILSHSGYINNPAAKVKLKNTEQMIDTSGEVIVPGGMLSIKEFAVNHYLFFLATNSENKKGVYFNGDTIVSFLYSDIKWKLNDSDINQILFEVRKDTQTEQLTYTLPKQDKPAMASLPAGMQKQAIKEPAGYFHASDLPGLKIKLKLDSIRFIEDGLAYIEKNKQGGFLIMDKIYLLRKKYTIISANLLTKFTNGCSKNSSKLLITVQVGDKYILMDENEKNFFKQEFTDTEGNYEYVVVKDYNRIGFFSKNICYPPIATKYDKFIDPLKLSVSATREFLIYRVLKNGKEELVGQNGVEYFSGL